MTLIKSYQFGHFEDIALLGSNLHLSKKNHKLYQLFSGSFDSIRDINIMGFPCHNKTCGKLFSTKFNRNKHEQIKGNFHGDVRSVREIPLSDATKVYMCHTVNCRTS